MRRRVVRWLAVLAVAAIVAAAIGIVLMRGEPEPPRFAEFIGDRSCLQCHQQQRAFEGTAHHRTSAPAGAGTIAASFAPGENTLGTPNPGLRYRMEAHPDGFFQTAVVGEPPDTTTITKRIDLVIGSGRKGQTYLYWDSGNRLYQLPISYWTALRAWISSPGYPEGVVNFHRVVAPRCLECHATHLEPVGDTIESNRYDREKQVLGVTCEKCHGPGREHVERQGSVLGRLMGNAVVNPAELPRTRQLEQCAQCHGGIGEPAAPAFSYRPGEPLQRYLHLSPPPNPDEVVDVHGNQVALLMRSPCFQGSNMTCSTCHDVHRTQRDAAAFSARCLTCHQAQSHEPVPAGGPSLATGCVDCHMPELPSSAIVSVRDAKQVRPRVRTHWIRVYSEEERR
jgi:hypothetical protein